MFDVGLNATRLVLSVAPDFMLQAFGLLVLTI